MRRFGCAKERVQFGKPIGGHQLVQQLIAEMATELEASRLLIFRALSLLRRIAGSNVEAAMAKVFTRPKPCKGSPQKQFKCSWYSVSVRSFRLSGIFGRPAC